MCQCPSERPGLRKACTTIGQGVTVTQDQGQLWSLQGFVPLQAVAAGDGRGMRTNSPQYLSSYRHIWGEHAPLGARYRNTPPRPAKDEFTNIHRHMAQICASAAILLTQFLQNQSNVIDPMTNRT
jgi:hypothetical protein